jgi:hypothetical protein
VISDKISFTEAGEKPVENNKNSIRIQNKSSSHNGLRENKS